ncbi:MAG TPA: EscU/YscU/HrcU family type III secretion system export apparatus switch protein [Rhodanobacter sp.]
MAEGDQDKTEQPTPYRLEEARNQGEVAKSADMVGVIMLMVFAVVLVLTAGSVAAALAESTRRIIAIAGARAALGPEFSTWLGRICAPLLQALMPMVIALLVTAVVANLMQTGPIFTTHPLKPDFKRLNPRNAIKRLFSLRILWELGKLCVKLLLLAALGVWALRRAPDFIAAVVSNPPDNLPSLWLSHVWRASLYVLLILALAGVADLLFVRRDYMRRMRTSRRELRDEVKRRDGNPEVKSKQKRQIRELLKKVRALSRVADADVILTNPTHYAVAMQYRPGSMRAPIVLAKGRGFLAVRVRALAARHGVPVVRSPQLARALYRECDIDAPVPESLYAQLAPVYRQVLARRSGTLSA